MKITSVLQAIGMVVASFLALGALAACGGNSMSNGDLLKEAIQNDKKLKSFHLDMNIAQGKSVLKLNGDVDAASKKYKVVFTQSGSTIYGIKIGDKLYTSKDDVAWMEGNSFEAGFTDALVNMLGQLKPEAVDQVKDRLKDGSPSTEKIEGADTRHMTAGLKDLEALGGGSIASGTEGTVSIWVSTGSNPTIRKLAITGKSDGDDIAATITRSKVDEPVDVAIEAPARLAPTPTSGPPPAAAEPSDNFQLLSAARDNMSFSFDVDSYHIDAELVSKGQTTKIEGLMSLDASEYDLDTTFEGKQSHVTKISADEVYQSTDGEQNATKISGDTASDLDEKVTKLSAIWSDMGLVMSFDASEIDSRLKEGSPATETIDGVSCKHLVADIADFAGELEIFEHSAETTGELHFWINTEGDPFVRQVRIDGKNGDQEVTGLIKWSRFSEEANIKTTGNYPGARLALLKEAFLNMSFLEAPFAAGYHVELEMSVDGKPTKLTGDVKDPEYSYKLDITADDRQKQIVRDGQSVLMSTDNGQTFVEASEDEPGLIYAMIVAAGDWPGNFMEEHEKSFKDGSPIIESIDGVMCKHIVVPANSHQHFAESIGDPDQMTGDLHIWINLDGKQLPRQMTIDAKSEGKVIKGTIKWDPIDEEETIETPSPSNSVPAPDPTPMVPDSTPITP